MTLQEQVLAGSGQPATESDVPPVPRTIRDTGLSPETITALALKTVYVAGARTGREIAGYIRLPFEVLDEALFDAQQRHMVQVSGVRGHSRAGYVFDLTNTGRDRARELFQASHYVGPAPVPLKVYHEWVLKQSMLDVVIEPEEIDAGLNHLVLGPEILRQLGPAINSGRSMFLYGHAGNGKTEIAQSIAKMISGSIYVPYAIEVEGRVIVAVQDFDLGEEIRKSESDSWLAEEATFDIRFAHVPRPVVFTGGELSLEQMDLRFDPHARFYRAPLQLKANGGVLIIDDLGRQLVRPDELLNRWMVPLEKRADFLTLHTGHSFPVPFDCLLIFSTNLEPSELVDEAFLRRIHYKINMRSPSREEYAKILRRCCEEKSIEFDPNSVETIYDAYYDRHGIPPRGCHPRDIVLHLCDLARYERSEPMMGDGRLEEACESYFLT
jgi:predicted ATPase with chaperone activity